MVLLDLTFNCPAASWVSNPTPEPGETVTVTVDS